jgi:hypothetical protein
MDVVVIVLKIILITFTAIKVDPGGINGINALVNSNPIDAKLNNTVLDFNSFVIVSILIYLTNIKVA